MGVLVPAGVAPAAYCSFSDMPKLPLSEIPQGKREVRKPGRSYNP